MQTEAAAGCVFEFAELLRTNGILHVLRSGDLQRVPIGSALETLRRHGTGSAIADFINDTVKEVFQSFCVKDFERSCECEDANCGVALVELSSALTEACMMLRRFNETVANSQSASHGQQSLLVEVRCSLLQDNCVTGEQPKTKKVLLAHVGQHALHLLKSLESCVGGVGLASMQRDATLLALHNLGLSHSPEIRYVWRQAAHSAIAAKLDEVLEEDDGTVAKVQEIASWRLSVLVPFIKIVTGLDVLVGVSRSSVTSASTHALPGKASADLRADADRWIEELEQFMLHSFAQRRIHSFFDLVVDFPSSTPALMDLRYCLQRSSTSGGVNLLQLLVTHAKGALAQRLHRAGTSTEDILIVVVRCIRALCLLVGKNEQGSVVFAVVGDTLHHLRERKDSVAAVVADITQDSSSSILYADVVRSSKDRGEESDEDDLSSPSYPSSSDAHHQGTAGPDVLRVLLSTLSVQAVMDAFRGVLANRLLTRPQHDYDTMEEEEVLERIKCVFGEDVLAPSAVMIRDVQMSRRLNQRVKQLQQQQPQPQLSSSGSARLSAAFEDENQKPAVHMSATILSHTCWPKSHSILQLPNEPHLPHLTKFSVHPALASLMTSYAASFGQLKPNQELGWICDLGRVTLSLPQRDPATGLVHRISYEMGLLSASIMLFLKDEPQGHMTVEDLAARLGCAPGPVLMRAQQHHPCVFVVHPRRGTVALQTSVVTASTFSFEEDAAADAPGAAAGLSQEEMTIITNTVTAMLKARSASKTAAEICNTLKMFIKYSGTVQDIKKVLQQLVMEGKLATSDGGAYSLPKP